MKKYDEAQDIARLARVANSCLKVVKMVLNCVKKPDAEAALVLNVAYKALSSQIDDYFAGSLFETLATCYHARNCLAEALGHFAAGNTLNACKALAHDRLGAFVDKAHLLQLQRQSWQNAIEQIFEKAELNANSVEEVTDALRELVGIEH